MTDVDLWKVIAQLNEDVETLKAVVEMHELAIKGLLVKLDEAKCTSR